MSMRFLSTALAGIAAVLCTTPTFALEPAIAAPSPALASAPRPAMSGARPLASTMLAAQRGGLQVVNDMKLKGAVAGNQAINAVSGSNWIGDGAFSGSTGMPMVIQNSGHNVLIQNATIVNVQVQ